MNVKPKVYRYNDNISFRICSLSEDGNQLSIGDCTNSYLREFEWGESWYLCRQHGIHLHCTKHPEIELNKKINLDKCILICPKCKKEIIIKDIDGLLNDCRKILNVEKFKDAQLIRVDDWYTREIDHEVKVESDYWIKSYVKTDKDNDTIIILYVGKKHSNEKAQFFIKPEKLQLTHDYNDLDPASVISKIEITLKDRTLKQEYEGKELN